MSAAKAISKAKAQAYEELVEAIKRKKTFSWHQRCSGKLFSASEVLLSKCGKDLTSICGIV